MTKILLLPVFFICSLCYSQQTNIAHIIPQPVNIELDKGFYKISSSTLLIVPNKGSAWAAEYLNNYLLKYYGYKLRIIHKPANGIFLSTDDFDDDRNKDLPGKYNMVVNQYGIEISSENKKGIFYAIQTLIQLLPPNKNSPLLIPQLSITDYPRFPYRGMHLDVGRHFFPPSYIKKYIDYLAYYKFNTFHWHLTEDQGWRIEIKKYPKLTSVGGYRNGTIIGRYPGKGNDGIRYGGFYTQDEIKEIVQYAADRYITVIPEIEMPGHSSAAIAAYPQLSCFPDESTKPAKGTAWSGSTEGKQVQQAWGVFDDVYNPSEYTFNFLQDVLDEVMQLFPSKYIHIGGDECPKSNWKRSAFCQQLIKEKGLKDEHGLQSYFIQRMEKYLNSKGRNIIGWDEILEGGLAPNATVMSWRGEKGGVTAANQNHNVIMTPENPLYLNHAQIKNEDSITQGGYNPIENVYNYNPVAKQINEEKAKYILGAQGNMWTEYIKNTGKLEYMLFPRMSALSEALWTPPQKKDWKGFEKRLPDLFNLYQFWGTNYSNGYYNLASTVLPAENFNGITWKLETKKTNGKIIYVAGRTYNSTRPYKDPILITSSGEYGAALTNNIGKIMGTWTWQKFLFNKATGKNISLTNLPSGNWQGNGGFTLVNGIITEKKLEESSQWLGFLGKDMDAVIDLGKKENINLIRLNVLKQEGSWIYLPVLVEFFISDDGINFTSVGKQLPDENGNWKDERHIEQKLSNTTARYVKIFAKNYGIIPVGKPGEATPAWLFADEIEVD